MVQSQFSSRIPMARAHGAPLARQSLLEVDGAFWLALWGRFGAEMGSCKQGDGLGFPQKNWEQPTKWSWIVLHVGRLWEYNYYILSLLLLLFIIIIYIYMQPTKMRPYENEMFRAQFYGHFNGKSWELWNLGVAYETRWTTGPLRPRSVGHLCPSLSYDVKPICFS